MSRTTIEELISQMDTIPFFVYWFRVFKTLLWIT